LELYKGLSEFSVKLLNNVQSREELKIVLNKTGREREEKYSVLARLGLAIEYGEKPVIKMYSCNILQFIELIFAFQVCCAFKLPKENSRSLVSWIGEVV
jgi:hypothetical protein